MGAAEQKLPILGTSFTADQIVAHPTCMTFIKDHFAINASHPGAQAYYDSIVSMWAEQGIDFIYFDGVVGEDCGCHLDQVALLADYLKRLGNGMYMFTSYGPPAGPPYDACSFAALSDLAPYVRVGNQRRRLVRFNRTRLLGIYQGYCWIDRSASPWRLSSIDGWKGSLQTRNKNLLQ